MAPYIIDALHLAGYQSMMASYQTRNEIKKSWPKTTVQLKSGGSVEVFDRLYLLYSDRYLTQDFIDKVGQNYKHIHTEVPSVTVDVGDYVTYYGQQNTILTYGPVYTLPPKYPDYDERFVGNDYKVVEVVERIEENEVGVYTDLSIVVVEVPIEDDEVLELGKGLTDEKRASLLLDGSVDSRNARKRLYETFALDKVIQDAIDDNSAWNGADDVWVEFSGSGRGSFNTNHTDLYGVYERSLEIDKTYKFEISRQGYGKTYDYNVASLNEFLSEPVEKAYLLDNGWLTIDIFGNEKYTQDEKFALFLMIMMGEDNYNIERSYLHSPYQWTEDSTLSGNGVHVRATKSIDVKLTKHATIEEAEDALEWMAGEIDRVSRRNNSDYDLGYHSLTMSELSTLTAIEYLRFLHEYMPSMSTEFDINPDLWIHISDTVNWSFTNLSKTPVYGMRVDGILNVRYNDLQIIFRNMVMDYEKDESKNSMFLNVIVMIVTIAAIMAAVITQQYYALGTIGTFALGLGTAAVFIGMQIATANAGYHKASVIAGMGAKAYAMASIMTGVGAALNAGWQKIAAMAAKMAVVPVIKELSKTIAKSFGSEAGAVFSVVATTALMYQGSTSTKAIGQGILGGINAGMATFEELEAIRLEPPRLNDEDREIMEEMEENEEKLEELKAKQALSYLSDGIDTDQSMHSLGSMLEVLDNESEKLTSKVNSFHDDIHNQYFNGSA